MKRLKFKKKKKKLFQVGIAFQSRSAVDSKNYLASDNFSLMTEQESAFLYLICFVCVCVSLGGDSLS